MQKPTCAWPVVLLLLGPLGCSALPPAPSANRAETPRTEAAPTNVKAKLEAYVSAVDALRAQIEAEEPPEPARKAFAARYREAMADLIHNARLRLAAFPPDLKLQVAQVEEFKDFRQGKIESLRRELPGADALEDRRWATGEMRKENDIYLEHLQEILSDKMIQDHAVRVDVFKRKYFSGGEDDKANFLEGYLNSKVPFFSSTEDPTISSWYRTAGVSQFESTLRLEPLVIFDSDKNFAALATAGLVYHFFPTYDPVRFEANPSESLLSRFIQRVGIRGGIGAQNQEGENFDLIFGAGLQVRSFTSWSIYNVEESDFFFGVGVSDLKFLEGLFPML